jgi:hypothetical protein
MAGAIRRLARRVPPCVGSGCANGGGSTGRPTATAGGVYVLSPSAVAPELVAVLPLYLRAVGGAWRARELRFISTGAFEFEETPTEYLDLLHAPGEAPGCVEAIARVLGGLHWHELCLSDMLAGSPLLGLRGPLGGGMRRARQAAAGPCYLFDLCGGFEADLARLSHENRRQARKLLRAVEQAAMTFELARDGESIDR